MTAPRDAELSLLQAIRTDLLEVKRRIGQLEGSVAALSRRVDGEMDCIQRRLDLRGETVGD